MFTHAPFKRRALSAAISVTSFIAAGNVIAQSAPEATEEELSYLEEVVVTGVFKAEGQNELDTSISVSSVDFDAVVDAAPRNMAEVFRNLPGIRSESSSGGGNSNIAIRGIPLSTGGAKFLQIHEDGLPVLLFGDFDFAPADGYLKLDSTLARVESVRGGTASTLTTNGAGGIINSIGKTGADGGGSAGLTYGLDHDDFRIDLEQGGELSDTMYYHIGGHFQQGGDHRDSGYDTISGGQVRATVTKEYENGFVRIIGKVIDKKDAAYFPQAAALSGNNVGDGVPGLDLNIDSLQSPYTRFGRDVDGEGRINDRDLADGIHTKVNAIGAELNFDFDNGINLSNKVRYQDISGDFNGAFTNSVSTLENMLGTNSGATIFNGPDTGAALNTNADLEALTGNNLISDVAYFHTNLDDMSNFANELRLAKSFDFGGSSLDLVFGHFFMNQNFKQDWHWSQFFTTTNNNAALVEIPGRTTDGQVFNRGFGWDGSNRNYDLEYQANSPFIGGQWSNDTLTLDASLRQDNVTQSGVRTSAVGVELDVNQDGVIGAGESAVSVNTGQVDSRVDFEVDNTAWSLGANYRISDGMAVFGRASSGASFNGERQMDSSAIAVGGGLVSGGDEVFIDVVDQYEFGIKWQAIPVGDGDLDLYATVFYAETEESNFQLTGGGNGTVVDNEYESTGIEFESRLSYGNFDLFATVTWTDAEISASDSDPTSVGNTPQRQADFIWNISPTYSFNDQIRVGAQWVGTDDSPANFANTITQEGYSVVHLFATFTLSDNLDLSVNVNNAFDETGVTESVNDGRLFDVDGDGVNDHTVARSILGRTATASIRFAF